MIHSDIPNTENLDFDRTERIVLFRAQCLQGALYDEEKVSHSCAHGQRRVEGKGSKLGQQPG